MMVLGSAMVVAAVCLWGGFVSNNARSGKTTVVMNAPPLSIPHPGETKTIITSTNDVPRVDLQAAKAAFDAQEAVFVDVRTQASYDNSHIVGALLIPYSEIEQHLPELDPSDWFILYCT